MKKLLIKHSFKKKLFFIVLAITLTLVIFGGILTIQGFQARIKADHERDDMVQEEIINQRIEDILISTENVLDAISESKTLSGAVGPRSKSAQDVYAALYEVSAPIRDFSVVDIYFGGVSHYSSGRGDATRALPMGYGVLAKADKEMGKTVYDMDPNDVTLSGATLIIARKISDYGVGSYAVVRISEEALKKELTGAFNARDGFMLTNEFFRPICLAGTAEDGINLAKLRKNFFKRDVYNKDIKENIYIKNMKDTGLISIYITPPAFEESAVKAGYQIIIFQAFIGVLLCLLVASRMSTSISRPISILTMAMKQFRKGDFDTKIELNREDEFGQLASGFNKMTAQLKETIQDRVEAERKVNESRIELMQAQLNPHFLYNTLDTIKWVAKANQVPEVATLSSSLATILRTAISESQFCMLENELDLVKNYCDIQKIRFDDCFDLEIDVEKDILKAYVPKLILQPLVENSIIHGLEGRSDGKITVSALKIIKEGEPDALEIVVKDNGKGISDEMIALIESDDPSALEGHLGLKNVNTIIRLFYGKNYGIKACRLDDGTKITVLIPFSLKEPKGGMS